MPDMTTPHLTDTIALETAIARLDAFVATYPDSALPSMDDLRKVIEAAKRGAQVVPVRRLDLSGPLPDDLTR